ncbi:UNVERIFIED_CONTAM: hypothetical protein RMT77_008459 [Armadillidium vulgare]
METSTQKIKQYKQKFRHKWLENELFCDWLAPVEGSQNSAYCKACKCFLRAKLTDLINHRKSKKHGRQMEGFKAVLDTYKIIHHTKDDEVQELENNADENEQHSPPIFLSDGENNFNIGTEVQRDADFGSDIFEPHSSRSFSKSVSKGFGMHKIKYRPSGHQEKHFRKFNLHDDPELSALYPKLVIPSYHVPAEDELTAFGRSIIAQMRKLPEDKTVRLGGEIQSLITQARIEYLEEQRAKENAAQNQQIISSPYKTDTNTDIQSDQVSTINNPQL